MPKDFICRIAYLTDDNRIMISFPLKHAALWMNKYGMQNATAGNEKIGIFAPQEFAYVKQDNNFKYFCARVFANPAYKVTELEGHLILTFNSNAKKAHGPEEIINNIITDLENVFGTIARDDVQQEVMSIRELHEKRAQTYRTAEQFRPLSRRNTASSLPPVEEEKPRSSPSRSGRFTPGYSENAEYASDPRSATTTPRTTSSHSNPSPVPPTDSPNPNTQHKDKRTRSTTRPSKG